MEENPMNPTPVDPGPEGPADADPVAPDLSRPASILEIEQIRGGDCAGSLKTLMERRLVKVVGKKDVIGRPFLFGTSREFLEVFGLASLSDLPSVRAIEEFLAAAPVARQTVLDPGAFVDPERDEIRLDGNTLVPVREEQIYLMAYKPDNVVSTMKDKEGRQTVASLAGGLAARVFPVGRLDYHTTGLILFTHHGELAFKLTHPRFGVEKTYVAKLMGAPPPRALKILRQGLPIDGVMTNPAQVNFLDKREGKSWSAIRIAEGRYHQVPKVFEAIGHQVMKLRRVAIGPLELAGVEPGEWRYLTGKEVRDLKAYVDHKEHEPRAAPPRPPGGGAR